MVIEKRDNVVISANCDACETNRPIISEVTVRRVAPTDDGQPLHVNDTIHSNSRSP